MNEALFPAHPAAPRDAGIHVGIGGWVYAPWRENFYPKGLVQRRELEFASRQVSAIEINGTYYGTQKPTTYAKWRDETPQGFVFSAKAPMRIMQSRDLTKAGPQIEDFLGGIAELEDRLGPIVWQFDAGTRIDPDAFVTFLDLLPKQLAGRRLRHVLDVRAAGFINAERLALLRERDMAIVYTDSADYPSYGDLSSDFVYARLMRSRSDQPTGYTPGELSAWVKRIHTWRAGEDPADLPHVAGPAASTPREVFVFFIGSAKERNPAAAIALLQRLRGQAS